MPAARKTKKRSTTTKRQLDGRGNDWVLLVDHKTADSRIVMAEAVLKALHLADSVAEFKLKSDALHDRLAEWAFAHRDRVAAVYTTVRDGVLTFVVVQRERAYDFSLEDPLTELDLQLAAEFPEIPFSPLQLPACSQQQLTAFLAEQRTARLEGLS